MYFRTVSTLTWQASSQKPLDSSLPEIKKDKTKIFAADVSMVVAQLRTLFRSGRWIADHFEEEEKKVAKLFKLRPQFDG